MNLEQIIITSRYIIAFGYFRNILYDSRKLCCNIPVQPSELHTAKHDESLIQLFSNQTGVSYVEVTAEEGDNVTTYSVNKDNCLVYILDREWADYKYLYPVPKNALDINPNLRPQNPGWDD